MRDLLWTKTGIEKGSLKECYCSCGTVAWVELRDIGKRSFNCRACSYRLIKTTHGMTKTPLYKVYRCMLQRCYNPKDKSYKNYGGRGIYVCKEWKTSASAFLCWAKETYKSGLMLERINNDKGYSPKNCRWATRKEQNRNKRSNVFITFNGETKILRDWAYAQGLSPFTVSQRVYIGWTYEEALELKKRKTRSRNEISS